MKTALITVIFILNGILSIGAPIVNSLKPHQVEQYQLKRNGTVVLPTNFAEQNIIDQKDLAKLHAQKIHHIDLVYTQFKRSESFNQAALNQARINQLTQLLPKIKGDQPSWRLIEQTGAQDPETASNYFHGFVIHFSSELDYASLKTFFGDSEPNTSNYQVDNSKGATLDYSSGSTVHLKAHAVSYKDGSPVKGNYTLSYTEYRNPAQIALSGIPMTYEKGGSSYNFSSVGMYEITAQKDGEDLILNKPVVVDFNCTDQKEGVSFYEMDDKGNWTKRHDIEFKTSGILAEMNEDVQEDANFNSGIINSRTGVMSIDYEIGKDRCVASLNDHAWKNFVKNHKKNDRLQEMTIDQYPTKKQVVIKRGDQDQFDDLVFWNRREGKFGGRVFDGNPTPNDRNATLLASGADAGHTYPNMVKGLNSKSFGVYNCDQIYRIGKAVALSPNYIDRETGQEIDNAHVACVIDLNYNGSFSFHPNYLTCNAEGKNVILLFTKDKKVYMLNQSEFDALDKESIEPTLKMTDMTRQIKNSDDLAKYLEL